MSAPVVPFDPLSVAASMNEWWCLLKATRELRDADEEMMDTMLEANASGIAPSSPDAAAKVRSLARLMRSLNLDPDVFRRSQPEIMRELDAACLACTERSRCSRELWAGTAADTYAAYCPNTARLDLVRSAAPPPE